MVSGNAAAANADNLIYNVMFAFYVACSSFMSQNWGAGNKERMKKCYLVTLTYSFSAGLLLGGALFFFGRPFLSLFAQNQPLSQLVCIELGLWILLCIQRLYGLCDCIFQRNRQEHCSYIYCNHGILCISYYMDLYGICLLPYNSISVSAVHLLLGTHSDCRNHIL